MMLKALILLCCVSIAVCQDWCNIRWCATNAHVACNHNGVSPLTFSGQKLYFHRKNSFSRQQNFHPDCRRPVAVDLTASNILNILHRHNTLRNLTAAGQTIGRDGNLPTAVRMAQIRWDPTLAHLAGLNVRRCQVRQDPCRNTDEFNNSGQNLGTIFFLGNMATDIIVNTVIDSWFDQRRNTLISDIVSIVPGRLFDVGRFSTLVNERQTHIGCAISLFDQDSGSTFWRVGLLACNYAFTNLGGMSVYRTGGIGLQCVLGRDGTYPGLCTLDEPINPNE